MSVDGRAGPKALRRLLEAVSQIGTDLDLTAILHRIVEVAVDLVDARYGALGVLDATRTSLDEFIVVGIADDERALIGPPPKGHGILGTLILDPRPLRLPDLREHPDSYGFPPGHPPMKSFLGVPVFIRNEAYGNLYLTDKVGAEVFTDIDEELCIGLASAAGVAIDNARLHARIRTMDLIEDRERIARDLHDTVVQRLFATGLGLQATARLASSPDVVGPERVVERIQQAVGEIDATVSQVRNTIFELHINTTPGRSLRRDVLEVGNQSTNVLGFAPTISFSGPVDLAVDADTADHVVAVVREALANAARHAKASRVEVNLIVEDGTLALTVTDDGTGPGPRRAGGRGLDNIVARAADLHGAATIGPGPEGGTQVVFRVPVDAAGAAGPGEEPSATRGTEGT